VLYFLGTINLQINYSRVINRINEGGRSVPENITTHRYNVGLSYLKSKILIFESAYLIENSTAQPQIMAEIKNQNIVFNNIIAPFGLMMFCLF
jgi:predicted ABC-type ATPase